MKRNTKLITGSVVALAVIVVLGLVYAAFTQQLTINGTATGRSSSWKIYFSRLTSPILNGTAKELTAPTIKNNSTTIGDYSVSVTSPGDYIEYEFDVTNDGDYDATLSNLSINSASNLTYLGSGDNKTNDENNVKSQIEYTLKYKSDGTTVSQDDTLKSKETKTMRLRLTYKTFSDASLLPQHDVAISGLGISLTYTQDGNAKVNPNGTTPYVKPYDAYSVGDTFTLGTYSYHVIADSGSNQDYVVALKDTPLTTSELNTYGSGHLNRYTSGSVGTAYDWNDANHTGGMAYYRSETCGYPNGSYVDTGCTTSYNQSEVKYAVDAWAAAKFTDELKIVDGYSARLLKIDEVSNLGYEWIDNGSVELWQKTASIPDWVYNSSYWYWIMSQWNDSSSGVCYVNADGNLHGTNVYNSDGAVRPVINVYKSSISS